MKILLLGVVAIIIILWYVTKQQNKAKADESSRYVDSSDGSFVYSRKFLNSPEVKSLKQSVAEELSISVEELDRMSIEEIRQLAKEKGIDMISNG
jgi:hypothetical protein